MTLHKIESGLPGQSAWELINDTDGKPALRIQLQSVPFTDEVAIKAYLYCALEHFAGRFKHRFLSKEKVL